MVTLIYFLSNKTNLPPIIIQLFFLFLMWLVTTILVDDFKFVAILYLMFVPTIILTSLLFVGKSWFKRPNKKL